MVGLGQYVVAIAGTLGLVAVAHRWLGAYPTGRATTVTDTRELLEAGCLVAAYVLLTAYASLSYRGLLPAPGFVFLGGRRINPAVVLAGVVLVGGVALGLEVWVHGRPLADLGFRWPRTWLPAVVLLGVGVGQGLSGLWTGRAAVVSPLALAFDLYNPAVEEELFFRGVLQSKLERATTPVHAWLLVGALFGLAHAMNDFVGVFWIAGGGDPAAAVLLLARQTGFGLFVGVCYAKSRSLLAPVVAHYFTNDLADIVRSIGDWL